nr:hypothetical protein [Adlercreutzia caecimuris]
MSTLLREVHPRNIHAISSTFEVSKLLIARFSRSLQYANISDIVVAFEVLKVARFSDLKPLIENMAAILVALEVFKFDICSTARAFLMPLNHP